MDITSPITLWKDYDVLALPLNKSALSQKVENGTTVKEYYFDGYTTVDGRARAYIKIYENERTDGVVLYLADKSGIADEGIIAKLLGFGYSVAVLDYLGKSDRVRYTLYPKSLSSCNLDGVDEFTIQNDSASNWYIWTCIGRRAVKLLQELYGDTNIFALGVGLGGNTVYKLSAFKDGLTACATLLNILPNVAGEGNSLINYRASLDNAAYAPFCDVPLFMAICSNADDGSLDDMAELAKNTESLRHFRIVERAFTNGIKAVYDDMLDFFDERAKATACLPRPTLTPSNSEKNLYINIDVDDEGVSDHNTAVDLYVSFCIEDAPFRNWMSIPIISLGKNKYMAKINVCQDDKPIYAFANITYDGKTVISSNLLDIIPKSIGVQAHPGVSHRKIYDGSMGKDGWTARDGGTISLVKGPFDIDGVTSESNSLITFKPGDPLFRVPPDTLLQLMLCGKPQTVTVSVSDKNNKYESTITIGSDNNWQKFSLSHMNFKGAAGMLADWSSILMLELDSDDDFILGSVIWV